MERNTNTSFRRVLESVVSARFNSLDAATLPTEYRELAAQQYSDIAKAKPQLAGNLNGWLARLSS